MGYINKGGCSPRGRKEKKNSTNFGLPFFLPSSATKNHLRKLLFNKDKKHQLEKSDTNAV